MKKKSGFLVCMLVVCLIVASLYFDSTIIKGVSFIRNEILNQFFLFITFFSSEIIIFFLLTSLFLWRENKRRWIFPLWVCLGCSAVISFILKIIAQRARPFQTGVVSLLPSLIEKSYSVWNFSFPSFQSMLVFCAVPILAEQFPRLKKFWIGFAVLVAFSRMYFGLHFLSDVLAGGLIGYLIGMLVIKTEKDTKFGQKIYHKIFIR